MICEYGCSQEAKYQFGNGKWCCSRVPQQCKFIIEKNSEKNKKNIPWNKGITGTFFHSEETKKKMSKMRIGKNHPMFGKHHSKETREKISIGNKGKIISKESRIKIRNSNLGKKHSKESLELMSEKQKGHPGYNTLTISKIKKKYPTFSKIEKMRYNPDKPNKKEIQVHCKNHLCKNSKEQDGWFTPGKWQLSDRIRAIESITGSDGSYFYCCDDCKIECPLYKLRTDYFINSLNEDPELIYTSSEYQTFRQEVLMRANNLCEYCNSLANVVHHSRPQKLEPGFALDPDFGVACCQECHYKYGHRDECSTGFLANKICK